MHFLFSLLRMKGFYMFRALLADPQEALPTRPFVYGGRVMTVGGPRQWRTAGGGGFGGSNPPSPKFRSFDKAEPNFQFRENTSVTTLDIPKV
jgi:hypothetical protein